jgi:iron uptake system component EfeO
VRYAQALPRCSLLHSPPQAADIPQVKVTVNDKQCEPMTLTVNSGKTQFIIQNHSQKALEWEILKGVMVVEERENIARALARR